VEVGHRGVYATNMISDHRHSLVFIVMVRHSGFAGDSAKSRQTFMRAARAISAR